MTKTVLNVTHDTAGWSEFFDTFNVYTNSIRLKPFIDVLCKYVDPAKPALELGAGSGATAKILADIGFHVYATDYDAKVLERLRAVITYPESRVSIQQADMNHLEFGDKQFSIVYHQGLLEHFSDDVIVNALCQQKRIADWVIFDVPNNRDDEQHYGDERFLSKAHWETLINKSGMELVEYSGRMCPAWTYIFPHALFTNKGGIFSVLGKMVGKAYIFVCRERGSRA